MLSSSGPFTRPHPAIWRMVFGKNSTTITSFLTVHVNLIFFCILTHFIFLSRCQCYVLLVSGARYLSELGPSEDSHVLAGPKPTLCHKGSRHHGEDGFA